jgi:mannose-6-phosphate isomerase-like protein (cupin superfamily)
MKAGDELENPVTGERAVVRSGSEDTNGEYVLTDLFVRPGGRVALPHLHPALTETFEVVAGRIDFVRDGERSTAGPGQKVSIPPGTVHDWWNDGGADAHVRVEVRGPGTARFELLIETFWGLARDGKTNDKGAPNPLRLAVIAREFADVLVVAKPPPLVQKIVFGALAPIGRVLGYRAIHPEYSPAEIARSRPNPSSRGRAGFGRRAG